MVPETTWSSVRDNMYLAVAGSCAEQGANALVEYLDLSELSYDSDNDFGATMIEVLMGPNELIIGKYASVSDSPAQSFTFSGSLPGSYASPNDDFQTLDNDQPRGFAWGDNGTYFFTANNHSTRFRRWTLTTPYDLGTATHEQTSSITLSYTPQGMHMKDDGTEMWTCAGNNVYKLSLSTAYQISSGVTQSTTYNLGGDTDGLGDLVGGLITGMRFNPAGTKLYICYRRDTSNTETGTQGHSKVTQYDLTTAWDVSSRVLNSTLDLHPDIGYYSFTPPPPPPPPPDPPTPATGVAALVQGIDFSADGSTLVVVSAHADTESGDYKVILYKSS